jgi:hypothetical protein
MGRFTDLLFAHPSILEGLARILDLGGTLNEYNQSATPEEADLVALRSDWEAIGSDFRGLLNQVQADPRRALQAEG